MAKDKEKVTVEVVMKKTKTCKSCVRFENKDSDVAKSLYLDNLAFEKLGKPDAVNIIVSAG